jgi:hypothetical protein
LDSALVLGFPTGDVPLDAFQPFARSGVVALASPGIRVIGNHPASDPKLILVDAGTWPGNSGGPVINQPEIFRPDVILFGLVTGANFQRSYAIVTPVSRIKETLAHADVSAQINTDAWKPRARLTPVACARPPVASP